MSNPLRGLRSAGQAVWLDYLHRRILADGELAGLIADDGVTGLTSNPAIFQKAIGDSDAYDGALAALMARSDGEVIDLYEQLAIADIQGAADQFRPLWDSLDGRDGFVSLEVSPYLAHDTAGTLAEARRLWRAVDRPNLMIKVPGTAAGVPAIRDLIADGINVNVTLLFSVEAYLAVAEAHLAGLEARRAAGGDVSTVHGVASFFISRIDAMVDAEIDRRLAAGAGEAAEVLKALRGRVAIANAKRAYRHYLDMIDTARWRALAAAGAAPQRLLWASTGAKDPAYSDVLYVDSLIGPDTVNTMPPATLAAFRDHGVARVTLAEDLDAAETVLHEADRLGLDLPGVTAFLAKDGVEKFSQAFDDLLGAVAAKRRAVLGAAINGQTISPGALKDTLTAASTRAAAEGWTRRLWAGDASLWPGDAAGAWLGWLDAAKGGAVDVPALRRFGEEVASRGFSHVLLLGMGGSSLGPEVLAQTFGSAAGQPELLVLDSTDPDQLGRVAAGLDPARTLFIVASKSGSTLEPDLLHRYFHDLAERTLGAARAGSHFVAITDPGSQLEATAKQQNFWRIFHGRRDIGGRYSVLSNFGMVPAAAIGLDLNAVFAGVGAMARTSGASAPPKANPAVDLGLLLGVAAAAGRDKLTVIASPGLTHFGAWLEQLVAESTGKLGLGLIPVDGETLRTADRYGSDRQFAHLGLTGESGDDTATTLAALERAGHPVVRISLADRMGLFQEFLRWELATAVAGAVIGIDPFDQPDVEASKIKTRALTDAYEQAGGFAPETAMIADGQIRVFADAANQAAIRAFTGADPTLDAVVAAHLGRAGPGDYIALLAYLDRNPENQLRLQRVRDRIGDATLCPTLVQFGPRFLHSTGQAYKGGPNSGVFLQITADPVADLSVPGRALTFGVVEAAQARGDLQVLLERDRRALRIDLGGDIVGGLARLAEAVERALA